MVDASNRSSVQPPNHITDISSYLSLGQDFKDLARYIDNLNRTLTDNERALRITLKGLIDTFDDVNKEYQKTGKLTDEQARNLKVLLSNERMVIGWLKQLSSSTGGVGRNSRGDKSFEEYGKILKSIVNKRDNAMERIYKSTASIQNNISSSMKSGGKGGKVLNSNFFNNLHKVFGTVPVVKHVTGGLSAMSKTYRAGVDLVGSNEMGALRSRLSNASARMKAYSTKGPAGAARGFHAPKSMYRYVVPKTSAVKTGAKNIAGSLARTGAKIGAATTAAAGAATAAIPIIGAILVGVGLIFKELKKHSPVLQAVTSLFELAYSLFFMPIGNALGRLLLPAAEAMVDLMILWNDAWTQLDPFIEHIASILETFFKEGYIAYLTRVITELILPGLEILFDAFGGVIFGANWPIIKEILAALPDYFTMIQTWINGVISWFERSVIPIINMILNPVSLLTTILPTLLSVVQNVMAFFKDTLEPAINAIKNAVTRVTNTASTVKSAITNPKGTLEKVADNGKGLWNSTVGSWTGLKLATGGVITSPTIAMVGESGPEAVIPLDRANGLGATYVINVNGDVYGVSDLESRIERVIQRTANRSYYR